MPENYPQLSMEDQFPSEITNFDTHQMQSFKSGCQSFLQLAGDARPVTSADIDPFDG